MRNLYAVALECMNELDDIAIPYADDIEWVVNSRAKKRWGQCCRHPDGTYTIQIRNDLLNEDIAPINALKNTIIHELLHSCDGCMNHGSLWQKYAKAVNDVYGYGIKRCSSAEEKGIDEVKLSATAHVKRYAVRCEKCGKLIERERMSNVIKYPGCYRCMCGGSLVRVR